MTSPQNFPGMPPPGFPGGGRPPGGPSGSQPSFPPGGGRPPGGPSGSQPSFPPGGPGGPPPGGPSGFPPGGPGGGPPGGQMPTAAPPAFAPAMPLSLQGSSGISSCLFSNTYIWTFNGNNFWFFPIVVSRDQVIGYRWSNRSNRWSFRIISRNNIWAYQCFRW